MWSLVKGCLDTSVLLCLMRQMSTMKNQHTSTQKKTNFSDLCSKLHRHYYLYIQHIQHNISYLDCLLFLPPRLVSLSTVAFGTSPYRASILTTLSIAKRHSPRLLLPRRPLGDPLPISGHPELPAELATPVRLVCRLVPWRRRAVLANPSRWTSWVRAAPTTATTQQQTFRYSNEFYYPPYTE